MVPQTRAAKDLRAESPRGSMKPCDRSRGCLPRRTPLVLRRDLLAIDSKLALHLVSATRPTSPRPSFGQLRSRGTPAPRNRSSSSILILLRVGPLWKSPRLRFPIQLSVQPATERPPRETIPPFPGIHGRQQQPLPSCDATHSRDCHAFLATLHRSRRPSLSAAPSKLPPRCPLRCHLLAQPRSAPLLPR